MPTTALIAGGLGAAGTLGGAYLQSQQQGNAIKAEQAMFNTGLNYATQQGANANALLSPFIQAGQNALTQYQNALPGLTAPFSAATLPSTPGYQFALSQGLKSTQNSFAANGLASSGAAMKGAASFATGLAQSTYNNQFQNYLAQNAQIGNLLLAPAQYGTSAAQSLGSIYGQLGAAGLSGAVQSGGQQGASYTGLGSVLGSAGSSLGSSLGNTALLYGLLNGTGALSGGANGLTGGQAVANNNYFTNAFASSGANAVPYTGGPFQYAGG